MKRKPLDKVSDLEVFSQKNLMIIKGFHLPACV